MTLAAARRFVIRLPTAGGRAIAKWSFLTNHALVLLQLIGNPGSTLREIALELGLTERSVIVILKALEEDGIVSREKAGRRNRYTIDRRMLAEHLSRQTRSPYSFEQIAMQTAVLAREYGIQGRSP